MKLITIDIKSERQTVAEAIAQFLVEVDACKKGGFKVMKVIHGYGSRGVGGAIKQAFLKKCQDLKNKKFIEDLNCSRLDEARTTNHFVYILQGKKDDIINYKDNARFFTQYYPNKHKFIYFENADHRFKKPGELDRIVSETLAILNDK